MPLLSETLINQAKSVSIVDIAVRYHLALRRAGSRLVGLCPLHEETRPSFTLYPATNSWYCYGCRRGGDSIALVRALEDSCDFRQAVSRLVDAMPAPVSARRHASVPISPSVSTVTPAERTAALAVATRLYQYDLQSTSAALDYLHMRGIGDKVIAALALGYCAGLRRRDLLAELRHHGIAERIAWQTGLLLRNGRERFAGMLTIPERQAGQVVWLAGRSIIGKRFMLLPGQKYLLGLETLSGGWGVVAEGLFDWLSLRQWDIPAVTPFGAENLSVLHAELAHLNILLVALDNDGAGRSGLQRILQAFPASARPLFLPATVKDIGDLATLAGGRERLRATIHRTLGRHMARKLEIGLSHSGSC